MDLGELSEMIAAEAARPAPDGRHGREPSNVPHFVHWIDGEGRVFDITVTYPRRCALEAPETFAEWLHGGKAPPSHFEFRKLLPKRLRDRTPVSPKSTERMMTETDEETNQGQRADSEV